MKTEELPGFFRDADKASLTGQNATVRWNAVRLIGLLAGAVGGALNWRLGMIELWGLLALLGFAVALVAEVVLLVTQPQRDWYAGRALAESAKTLAWRFAVKADPFFEGLSASDLRRIMRERLAEVADKGKDRIRLSSDQLGVTPTMESVRAMPFAERRRIYIDDRIRDQRNWYASKADRCKRMGLTLQAALIAGEVTAIVAAAVRAFGILSIDLSGILAAIVASGAAWFGLRQYSSLASAYSVAAAELNLTIARLEDTEELDWALAVADAEEAISREHTMWLASRTGAIA